MNPLEKQKWWTLIKQIAEELTLEDIPYHFDASTSLFVHGIDFDMDDIDIVIQWDCFERAYNYFKKYNVSPIKTSSFSQFFFMINNMKVHVLSSERCTDLHLDTERVQLKKDNQLIWSKTIEFYQRHHSKDHPLVLLIKAFEKSNKV